jgi:hypothetical protein
MEVFNILDRKVRNIAIIILIIAVILLIVWFIFFMYLPGDFLILLHIGIALLLGGILIITRIQFVLWAKKRDKSS